MGLVSTGCKLCRKRRIKCGEEKPECKRCIRIGASCPGYDREFKLIFYDGNNTTSRKPDQDRHAQQRSENNNDAVHTVTIGSTHRGKTTSRTKLKNVDRQNAIADPTSSCRTSSPQGKSHSSHIIPGLAPDIETRSICLFLTSFVDDSTSSPSSPAFLDFLPDLFTNSSKSSCIRQTLSAVSQLNFLNRYKATESLSNYAENSYGQALHLTNLALKTCSSTISDELLASVWLLSLYELIAPGQLAIGQRTPWINHVTGTLQMLRMRGKAQFTTHTGRQLFRIAHVPIIAMTMMLGEKPSQEILVMNSAMLESDPEASKDSFLVSQYIHQVATTRSGLRDIMAKGTASPGHFHDLPLLMQILADGVRNEFENAFERWTSAVPDTQPKPVSAETIVSLEHPEYGLHFFESAAVMYNWITMWTTSMLHTQSLLNVLSLLPNTVEDLLFTHLVINEKTSSEEVSGHAGMTLLQRKLHNSIANIIGSVSFAFGDVNQKGTVIPAARLDSSVYNGSVIGAFHMFWPLGAILVCPYASTAEKALARKALKAVGERFCITQALQHVAI